MAIRELPLLWRAIDVATLMIEMTKAFLEACLGIAAEGSMQKMGAQIAVAVEQLEQLDVSVGQLDALAYGEAAHSGTALGDFQGPLT